MGDRVWYFAYGANMSRRAFCERLGMDPRSAEAAQLEDHALVFNEPGVPLIEPAFANVVSHHGKRVYGVLYRISPEELERLERCESANYHCDVLAVNGTKSGVVDAHVFRAQRTVDGRRPSQRYIRLLIAGAREHGLPATWIVALEATRCYELPVFGALSEQFAARYMWLRERGFRPERVGIALRGLWRRVAGDR